MTDFSKEKAGKWLLGAKEGLRGENQVNMALRETGGALSPGGRALELEATDVNVLQ